MKTPISVYALLVGINNYPNPSHRLNGCVRDAERMMELLEAYFNNDAYTFKPKTLFDKEATRANIIKGFQHFADAKDGDICFFHFSGHGSRCAVPKEFRDIESDQMHESIVCYDSRLPDGYDLADKEMSFLIWEATKGKDLHFVVAYDCCHSGTGTRNTYAIPKQVQNRNDERPINSYHGYKHFKKTGGDYQPPRGRHVFLAASRNTQTAKEVRSHGEPCGIFTYCLIEALKSSQTHITYAELINKIKFRIRNTVSDQTPQLETTVSEDRKKFFFSTEIESATPTYVVGYDEKKKNWLLNAGAIHGIISGDEDNPTKLEILGYQDEGVVVETGPQYSVVKGLEYFPTKQTLKARIKQMSTTVTPVAFASNNDSVPEQDLKDNLAAKPGTSFHIVNEPEKADYLIHAKYGHLFLSKKDEPEYADHPDAINQIRSVFKKIEGYTKPDQVEFLNCMESTMCWRQLLELSNPASSIRPEEIEISLFRTNDIGNYDNDASADLIDWTAPGTFHYKLKGTEWYPPAFKLRIRNNGNRSLWVSMVFLADNFQISNELLPRLQLSPGEETWVRELSPEGFELKTTPIQTANAYFRWGITEIQQYLKIFICTEEFSTDEYNQKGLKLDEPDAHPTRTIGRTFAFKRPDWVTKEIELNVKRPREALDVFRL